MGLRKKETHFTWFGNTIVVFSLTCYLLLSYIFPTIIKKKTKIMTNNFVCLLPLLNNVAPYTYDNNNICFYISLYTSTMSRSALHSMGSIPATRHYSLVYGINIEATNKSRFSWTKGWIKKFRTYSKLLKNIHIRTILIHFINRYFSSLIKTWRRSAPKTQWKMIKPQNRCYVHLQIWFEIVIQ